MSYLGREATSVDRVCHETLCGVELDSRHHPGRHSKRKESSAGQTESLSNNAYEEGHDRGHLRRVPGPYNGDHNHQGS